MKKKHWMVFAVGVLLGQAAFLLPLRAQNPQNPGQDVTPNNDVRTAVVKQNRVNVRAQAKLQSEVITQLNQGDPVTVLGEVTVSAPKAGEPDKWIRIGLPAEVSVWVHNSFIDPQSKAVTANRLNLRGGAGQRFSVLGQIPRGTVVQPLETQGDWIRIAAPESASAYIAAFLLDMTQAAPPPVVATTQTNQPPTVTVTETNVPTVDIPVPPDNVPPPIPVETVVIDTPDTITTNGPIETNIVDITDPGLVGIPSEPVTLTEPEETLVKRIVRREGIVKRSNSIQAPTYFTLGSVDNGRIINYLHSQKTNIVLMDFYGARIVVTGEEFLDERWPKVPVIEIETLETVP